VSDGLRDALKFCERLVKLDDGYDPNWFMLPPAAGPSLIWNDDDEVTQPGNIWYDPAQ
jgi:hypothetical protein